MMLLGQYNTAFTFRMPMVKAGSQDLATSSDWTPAAGDVKVSKDGGAEANITTLPTYTNGRWVWSLSTTEMSAAEVTIKVVDSATKAVEDNFFHIRTYGNASAYMPFDFSNIGGRLPTALTSNGNIKASLLEIIGTTLTESVGGYLTAGFKKLFDVAVPVFTAASVNQTGDTFARVGAPVGASISADIAAVPANVELAIYNEADATALMAAIAAKVEEFLINEGDATATLAAIATAVNSAVVAGTIGTNVSAIKTKTDNLPATPADESTVAAVQSLVTTLYDTEILATGTTVGTGTTTSFDSGLVVTDGTYNDCQVMLTAGAAMDQPRAIVSIISGVITVDEPFTAVVDNGRSFTIFRDHIHSITQIQSGLATQTSVDDVQTAVDANTGYLTDLLARVTASVYTMWTDLIAMITGTGATAKFTTLALSNAPAGGGGGSGTGARTITITVDDGTDPLENATVRMTEGANTYTATTNASGVATFNLDDATYTVAISKASYSYAGTTLVVAADAAQTYSMTAITITPGTGDFTTGYLTAYDETGTAEVGAIIYCELTKAPRSEYGYSYDSAIRTLTSVAAGLVEIPGLAKGATYRIWRGSRPATASNLVLIPTSAGTTYALPSHIGREQ